VDFNPTLVDDKPRVRGRFSARQSRDPREWYSYLYLGEQKMDERTALLECIDILGLGLTSDGASRALDIGAVSNLSFAYMKLSRNITLLDVTSEPHASVFQAQLETIEGSNYRATRRWGRYFREVAPFVDGICYKPKKYGSDQDGVNIVLFAPHRKNGDMIAGEFHEVPLDSHAGIGRMIYLSSITNIFLSGW